MTEVTENYGNSHLTSLAKNRVTLVFWVVKFNGYFLFIGGIEIEYMGAAKHI